MMKRNFILFACLFSLCVSMASAGEAWAQAKWLVQTYQLFPGTYCDYRQSAGPPEDESLIYINEDKTLAKIFYNTWNGNKPEIVPSNQFNHPGFSPGGAKIYGCKLTSPQYCYIVKDENDSPCQEPDSEDPPACVDYKQTFELLDGERPSSCDFRISKLGDCLTGDGQINKTCYVIYHPETGALHSFCTPAKDPDAVCDLQNGDLCLDSDHPIECFKPIDWDSPTDAPSLPPIDDSQPCDLFNSPDYGCIEQKPSDPNNGSGGGDTGGGDTGGGDTGSGGTGGGGTGGGGTGGGGPDGGGTGGVGAGGGCSDTDENCDPNGKGFNGNFGDEAGTIGAAQGNGFGEGDGPGELGDSLNRIAGHSLLDQVKNKNYLITSGATCSLSIRLFNRNFTLSLCVWEDQLRLFGQIIYALTGLGGLLLILRR